jgi:hypothetical protein
MKSKNKLTAILLIASMSIVMYSCSAQTPYEKLKTYLTNISDTLKIDNYDCILYVSDQGCPTCSKSFDIAIKNYAFNREHVLIILNAKGQRFDIMPYLDSKITNTVKDFTSDFYRLRIASTSCIITLKDKSVEQIVELNGQELSTQLDLLQKIILKNE